MEKKEYILTTGKRKNAIARVWMTKTGHGKITINGKSLADYFPYFEWQDIVQAPIKIANAGSMDYVIKVAGGGVKAQSEAIRHAIALAMVKLDETLKAAMRTNGFMTRDARKKERKKPGLRRARRAPQFSKR